jgi:hypothetical protein
MRTSLVVSPKADDYPGANTMVNLTITHAVGEACCVGINLEGAQR